MKILVVEDDALLRQGLQQAMQHEHFSCDTAATVHEAESLMHSAEYGLVLLDLGLPDGNGIQLLRQWRAAHLDVPVMILTARDSLQERVQGLDLGADDYLCKPFALAELQARVRALLRRHQGKASNQLSNGGLVVDIEQRQASQDGEPLLLTRREYALLRRLILQVGQVVSRERLQADLYDWQDDIGSNALEVHIHHLRRKLDKQHIRTVRGEGYCLEKHHEAECGA